MWYIVQKGLFLVENPHLIECFSWGLTMMFFKVCDMELVAFWVPKSSGLPKRSAGRKQKSPLYNKGGRCITGPWHWIAVKTDRHHAQPRWRYLTNLADQVHMDMITLLFGDCCIRHLRLVEKKVPPGYFKNQKAGERCFGVCRFVFATKKGPR